ncbi:hypothetical protein [Nocardia pseudobrasiliensis]|uniref:Phage baseplate assembly protein W n=1 Tax=Nocardia pseudobrasiliensis TaxID=45979 RepID=A0A370IBU9_9NOCA|nr:hypothetical protein [Nocardia pseudobrasiliensis]RDI68163.1 hypothetical protein DFR76_102564 [Nocardia pseudobrasiliensis]
MNTPNNTGIRLEKGDLVIENGAIATRSGLPNLAQDLQIRLLTPLGGDRYDIRYGLDYESVFTTPVSAHEMRDLLRLNIVRTLSGDSRVQEIRDIQVSDPGIDPRHRVWQVVVSIITSDGVPAVLTTTVGAPA